MNNLHMCVGRHASREEAESHVETLWEHRFGASSGLSRKTVIFDDFMDYICFFATDSLSFASEEELIHQLSALMNRVMRMRNASSAKDLEELLRGFSLRGSSASSDAAAGFDSIPASAAPSPELDAERHEHAGGSEPLQGAEPVSGDDDTKYDRENLSGRRNRCKNQRVEARKRQENKVLSDRRRKAEEPK